MYTDEHTTVDTIYNYNQSGHIPRFVFFVHDPLLDGAEQSTLSYFYCASVFAKAYNI